VLGEFHAASGVLAILLGLWIFLSPKGTRRHVQAGWAYVAAMLCLNLSGFCIYHITGGFNLFHVVAIINLVLLAVGVAQVIYRTRWRNWLWRHYQYMCWSYVALLTGASNEAFVRIPPLRRLKSETTNWLPLMAAVAIMVGAALIITGRQKRALERYVRPG